MLQPMPQPARSQPSPALPTFAGLLATLTSPPPASSSEVDNAPGWTSSDLGEDVATLSYERALRTHARYRPASRGSGRDSLRVDGSRTAVADPGSVARADAPNENGAADVVNATGALGAAGAVDVSDALDAPGAFDAAGATVAVHAAATSQAATARESDLRSASVTIRLSRAECARLHQRAAEAGLTVSAYLRSCTVEADALRAQVKQALAEFKAGAEGSSHACGQESTLGGAARDRGNKKAARRTFVEWIRWLTRRGR
jgi:hypothetical protein